MHEIDKHINEIISSEFKDWWQEQKEPDSIPEAYAKSAYEEGFYRGLVFVQNSNSHILIDNRFDMSDLMKSVMKGEKR